MSDYEDWQFKPSRSVSGLYLDELNVRLPGSDEDRSQADLIEELCELEDVFAVAKSIAVNGFFPPEAVVAMPREGSARRLTVLEGNRRLAALKVLDNPELAPKVLRARFKKLADRSISIPKKIGVWVVPSRESAELYIAVLHAPPESGMAVESWSPIQKATFYARHKETGASIQEIAQEFRVTEGQVAEYLRNHTYYQLAKRTELSGSAKRFWNPRLFPLSVISRIFGAKEARSLLRVEFDDSGGLAFNTPIEDFLSAYQEILSRVADETIDTRTINSVEEMVPLLKSLKSIGSVRKQKETTTSDKVIAETEPKDGSSAEKALPKKKAKKTKPQPKRFGNKMFAERLESNLNDSRLPSILIELNRIAVPRYVNGFALLLRTALELALIGWLKRNNYWNEVSKKAGNKKIGPMMSEMLKYVWNQRLAELNLDAQERSAFKGFVDGDSIDTLNAYVHNPNYPVDMGAIQTLAARIEPVIKALLRGKV